MATPHRPRRARTLVVAVFVALLGLVLLGRVAEARTAQTGQNQPCGGIFPACTQPNQVTTTTRDEETTTTEDDVTTTTEDDATNTTEDDSTDDTRRSTATTEEEVTTTVLQVTTSLDLLVPGDGTAGAESTTTSEKPKVTGGSSGLSDNQLVVLIVSGLTVFGTAIGLLTWRYWRATQPVEVPIEPASREANRPGPRTHRSVFLDP